MLVIALAVFEGAARKWLFPDVAVARYAAYFSKDVVFILAGLAGAASAPAQFRRTAGSLLCISSVLILPATLVNLHQSNLVGMALSLRAYVILPACAFLAAGTIRSVRDAERIVLFVCLCTVIVAALGCVQFYLPQNHPLNRYDSGAEETKVVFTYDHVRATGTFAYITGMALMGAFGCWAGTYVLLCGGSGLRRCFGIAVTLGAMSCELVSMSRGGFFLCIVTSVGGAILFSRRTGMMYIAAAATLAFWMFSGGDVNDEAPAGIQDSIVRRFQKSDTVLDRVSYTIMNLRLGFFHHPLGEGLGAGQVGASVAVSAERASGAGYESELGRIAFEVGWAGLLGVLMWRVSALAALVRNLRVARDGNIRVMNAVTIALFSMLALEYMAFNHTGSTFAWSAVSVALGTATVGDRSAVSVTRR